MSVSTPKKWGNCLLKSSVSGLLSTSERQERTLKMPFFQQTSRPFTKADIESLTPNQMGVYGIFRPDLWIYVGKGDIRKNLLAHVGGDNPDILKHGPTLWVGEVTADMDAREKQLQIELKPAANKRVG